MSFIHLHVHDWYSFFDGLSSPKILADRAKELGMNALAETNHNHLGGAYDFQQACKETGIKPILGCEMYYTPDTNILSLSAEDRTQLAIQKAKAAGVEIPDKINGKKTTKTQIKELIADYEYPTKTFHILFLAINQTGWNNLVKLQSEASEKCTYKERYLCDIPMIKKYSEGLIMTTACIGSYPAQLINQNRINEAETWIDQLHDIFQDRMYLEIQPLNIPLQINVNHYYIEWSRTKNIKLIATSDVHYARYEDHDLHDTLICMSTNKLKIETDRMHYSQDYWLRSEDEMLEAFSLLYNDNSSYMQKVREAINNTQHIADLIEDNIKLGSDIDLFPNLNLSSTLTPEEQLTLLSYKGLYKYSKKEKINLRQYEKRLSYELNIINKKGFAPYMLAVYEYVNWCKDNNIPVGPGRGSAAGSLCLFCIGVTQNIDPIKYKLLFSRFLTEDRTSPPDVDTDFSFFGRDKVIKHLEDLYGAEKVCHIGTYTVLGVKSGIKEVGRVFDMSFELRNQITKEIDLISDASPNLKFKDLDALQKSTNPNDLKKYTQFKALENKYPEIFRIARLLEGTPKNMGMHASGILVTPMAINDLFPTRIDSKTGCKIVLYTGPQLEYLKAIKFDILGLKTLDVLDLTVKSIDPTKNLEDFYETIDINDPKLFETICRKETDGIFQIESNLFKGMIEGMQPDNINDIIALTSIGRPGPLSAGMDKAYANRKHGLEKAVEPLPNTWDIVDECYGTIIYQESIMLIAKRVALFDDNQTDSYLRKAFAKKKRNLMDLCRQWFIYGKTNTKKPDDYNDENKDQIMYDEAGKYGCEIIGGISNGYDEQQLKDFWTNIEGFADYLFNKSHAACYSYVTVLTAYFKTYYPAKFMAALLTMQDEQDKIEQYIKVARSMQIPILSPDINTSERNFIEVNGSILYGLGSIKGVGEASVDLILNNKPYQSIEDIMGKIDKKFFNKRVGVALIKAGAFDFYEANRNLLLNTFYTIRKDKDDKPLAETYNDEVCIAMEKEVLGVPVTHVPFWENVDAGQVVEIDYVLKSVFEKADKKGRLMGFLTGECDGCEIKAIVFANIYGKNIGSLDMNFNRRVILKGEKDDKGTLIVSSIKKAS